ncbi:MAG TPA: UDP-N-acetylmuramoyl-L-alanyl-D-glutamate--2,6-diaminopimelate ligase [Tepidisphaeraceae bacterium]|nr:UDP-N-acetylmuramoyl-L-alanyl-D-glutamate--2,6-diaminopimelate ligase [Tepidisphaeraceae bacterium]
MRLEELIRAVNALAGFELLRVVGFGAQPLPGDVGLTRICDVTEDSRTIVPGSLFIARAGGKVDGKAFVPAAVRAGACAVVTDDPALRVAEGHESTPVIAASDAALATALIAEVFYGRPASSLRLVGVTGTNGKTTTTWLAWQLMNAARRRFGLVGTVVIDDGVETARAAMTTPPATEVSRTLARMRESGCIGAALEVSSHALDQKRADALAFDAAVFTNLSGDHLDYHKTMEAYAGAKHRLFALLREDGVAIVNALDPWWRTVAGASKSRVLRAGVGPGSAALDVSGEIVEHTRAGMRLALRGPWGEFDARTGLIGEYNAFNVLAAVTAAHHLGLPADRLAASLPALTAPPGRLERVSPPDGPVHVFVDYAHSDDSLRNVLTATRAVMQGKGELIAVFGCGGDRDRTKRPRMGLAASQLADRVIVTSDNPRTERPSDIIDEVLSGVPPHRRGRVGVQADRSQAIHAAIANATEGDVVVIAGKGHETEQILPDGKGGTHRIHFDDREVAREALARAFSISGDGR